MIQVAHRAFFRLLRRERRREEVRPRGSRRPHTRPLSRSHLK